MFRVIMGIIALTLGLVGVIGGLVIGDIDLQIIGHIWIVGSILYSRLEGQ